jgi:hypothetical protein
MDYAFAYMDRDLTWEYQQTAGTPEDAAAKLAIELFKQGILVKEGGEVRG